MAYEHLRPEEREVISQMFAAGASKQAIAKQLGRHRTTISREVRRNGMCGMYLAVDAQQVAERRRRQARAKSRKLNRPENLAYVQKRLRQCWSPDQIAGRSRRDFSANPERTLSSDHLYLAGRRRPSPPLDRVFAALSAEETAHQTGGPCGSGLGQASRRGQ